MGMTIDWLLSEQEIRSDGEISFPGVFEANYVWFKYRTYGHAPGRFYGDEDVWLHMPRGIVGLDNPQINWLSAEGNGNLYLGLANASNDPQRVTVTLDPAKAGLNPRRAYPVWIIRDNGRRRPAVMRGGKLTTEVSPKGITALVVRGVDLDVPLHRDNRLEVGQNSFRFDDESPIGIVRGMLLVKPDLSRYDAYVQAATEDRATLHYSADGGSTFTVLPDEVYPNEWTVPVEDLEKTFTYYVEAGGNRTGTATLSLNT
jgi:hypothetical protein